MGLPPKAIFALNSIKSSLIHQLASTSTQIEAPQSVIITLSEPPKRQKEVKSTVRMRHAKSGGAFQTMCRRKDWASPVF